MTKLNNNQYIFNLPTDAFLIDKDSGLITSRRLLQSFERFNLTVVATDKGKPPLWGTTKLRVEVIDVNDNRPVFVRPPNGTILHIKEVTERTIHKLDHMSSKVQNGG